MSKKSFFYLLILLFFFTRLIFLTKLPIFNDEAIYLDWGYRQINNPGMAFYSLYDGKQPLMIWLFGFSQKIFSNPLFAGRFVSILFSITTLTGVYKIALKIYNKKIAQISTISYMLIPLFTFYDRQALMESAISTIGIWAFYFLLNIISKPKTTYVMFLATMLGLGLFIKTSAIIFFITAIISSVPLLFQKNKLSFIYVVVAIIASQVFIMPLWMQEKFWHTLKENSRYTLSFSEITSFPWKIWFTNIKNFLDIGFWQITPFVFIFSIHQLAKDRTQNPYAKSLLLWISSSIIILIITARILTPRYLISFTPLLIIPFSRFISKYLQSKPKHPILLPIIYLTISAALTFTQILSPVSYFNFIDKFSSQSQKNSYVTSWTSGYGATKAVEFLKEKAKTQPLLAATRLDSGNPESALFAYFSNHPRITPTYFDKSIVNSSIFEYDCLSSKTKMYFVSRSGNMAGFDKYFQEISRFYQPSSQEFVGIHELNPDCQGKTLQI